MANLAQGWINRLRQQARNDQVHHLEENVELPPTGSIPRPALGGDPGPEDVTPARKRLKSPTTLITPDRPRSPSPTRRSKGRHKTPADKSTSDFPARPTAKTKGRLWNENDPILTRNLSAQPAPQQHPRQFRCRDNRQATDQTVEEEDPSVNKMIGQPETRPISQEQLAAEVKGIYAGLVMVESKCIETEKSLTAKELGTPTGMRSLLNKSYKARERRYLPLKINCKPAHALLDSGATDNAICEDYAQAIGAVIERPSSKHHFANAINKPFESVDATTLTFSISADQIKTSLKSEWTCSFTVVQHLATPLVLSNQFLRETGALANFAYLIVRRALLVISDKLNPFRKVWMFMHMNLPTQKLGCFLDTEPAFAALDSGSDIDVVSLSYAKFRDWQIELFLEDEGYVLLANNELVKLAGYVDTTLGIRRGYIPRRLYVLDSLICDVVLGDPTIKTLDIFNEFQSSLIDTMAAEGTDLFSMIQYVDETKQIEHEVDQLLAERPSDTSSRIGKNWWMSFLLNGASRKDKPIDDEGIVEELKERLEKVTVCSANCRRFYEAELMILSGDDHTRKKEEFDKRKKQNDELRDKIRQHIKARSPMPKIKSRSGSRQPSVVTST